MKNNFPHKTLFNPDFLKNNIKSKEKILILGSKNKNLIEILKNSVGETHIHELKIENNNNKIGEKLKLYQNSQFKFCILNFILKKNIKEILEEGTAIADFVALNIINKNFEFLKFLRLLKRYKMSIKNVEFYRKGKRINSFFPYLFVDKVSIVIYKSVASLAYQEAFVDKAVRFFGLKRKRPAFFNETKIFGK